MSTGAAPACCLIATSAPAVSAQLGTRGENRTCLSQCLSQAPEERHKPEILNGSRRRRIAQGSGTTPQDINQLLNQFRQTQKMVRQLTKSRNPKALLNMFK